MPLVLVLVPLALLVLYFATRSNDATAAAPISLLDMDAMPGASVATSLDAAASAGDWFAGAVIAPIEETMRKLYTIPPAGAPYADAITAAESRYGIPDTLLARLLFQESRFRPDVVSGATSSPAGALGIAQLMPATAAQLGVNPLDPAQAIDAAGRYLSTLYGQFGTWGDALAAYNWGPGNWSTYLRTGRGVKGQDVPPETVNYVSQILSDVDAPAA